MAAQLLEGADSLSRGEVCAFNTLSSGLALLEADFRHLRTQVAAYAMDQDQPEKAAEAESASTLTQFGLILAGIEQGVRDAAQVEFNSQRDMALRVLHKCQRLSHADDPAFPLLQQCWKTAGELASAIGQCERPNGDPVVATVAKLVSGEHPIAALVRFVESGLALADEEWERLRTAIAEHFGQALAIAASRDKLRITDTSEPPPRDAAHEHVEAPASEETPSEVAPVSRPVAPPTGPLSSSTDSRPASTITTAPATPAIAMVSQSVATAPPPQAAVVPAPVEPAENRADVEAKVNRVLWKLIGKGHTGLAYHLALEQSKQAEGCVLPPWLLRATALGPCVRFPGGEIAQLLRQDLAEFSPKIFREGNGEWNQSIRLLCAAAALRAALLAPETEASSVLYQLHFGAGLEQLYRYCELVANFGDRNYPLDPAALKQVQDATAWRKELQDLRERVEIWFSRAPQMGIKYAPAAKVWRWWLQKDRLIWNLVKPIRGNDTPNISAAEHLLSKWSNMNEIDRHVRYTDRTELERRGGKDITADALFQIRRHTTEGLDFLRSWIELQRHSPEQAGSYSGQEIEALRRELQPLQENVLQELQTLRAENSSTAINVVGPLCETTVMRIGQLFDPLVPIPITEPNASALLNTDLLRVPGLQITEGWEPQWASPDSALETVEPFADRPMPTWIEAFGLRSKEGDHRSTMRMLEYLNQEPQPNCGPDVTQQLQLQRDRDLRQAVEELGRDAVAVRREVEKALSFGLITERDHIEMVSLIQAVEESCDRVLDFGPQRALLSGTREDIEARRTKQVEEARQRLEAEIPTDHPACARILEALNGSDVLTAHAYMDMVRQNMDLPELAAAHDALTDFFPERVRKIEDFLESFFSKEKRNVRDLATQVKTRQFTGPIDMAPITGAAAERAAAGVEAWFEAKKERSSSGTLDKHIRELFGFLGFQGAVVSPDRSRRGVWMNVRTVPLTQREQCPIPRYGSEAKGHYRVLCVWERPNEEDLVNEIGDALSEPVIVFFFGRLTEQRRRNLARLCRERRRTFLVLDEILILHLCGVAGSRLPVFFNCAVPFTYLSVYVTSAGLVPPEMFYGRKAARESVLRADGSCFIYGGRQLGKTALLRDVERQFHAPEHAHWALWVDLKARGIGYDRPVDDLWAVLEDELARLDIVKKKGRSVDKLLDVIAEFILGDSRRRILLLLDEADRFLELDGNRDKGGEYVRAARLKGLMDRTNRRFKVVFAGLHNVQRTTTLGNHPLAHYGTPICVGPLFDGGEWREARALIEAPFAAVGYRFEHPDLAIRILSQTNYYPSLIQLYGHQLFLHLVGQNMVRADWRSGPPFVITARDVEDAYHSQDLRKAIRDRFIWTLQLDKRYEVIAYAIGFALVGDELNETDRGQFALHGFPVPWIQREAFAWWSEGFAANYSEDSFRVLLDEMVGLGILRPIGNRYGLRSPNVLALMGTVDEITSKLLEEREPEADYTPAVARAVCSPDQGWRRSPFAGHQEDSLKNCLGGVSVVVGLEAAGLLDVPQRLRVLFGEAVADSGETTDVGGFVRFLADSRAGKKRDPKRSFVVVPPDVRWDEEWVRHAIEFFRQNPSGPRVAFTLGPGELWRMLALNNGVFAEMEALGTNVVSLLPWHQQVVRQWLDDCGFALDAEGRKRIHKVTGNWPLPLYRFYELSKGDESHWEAHLAALERTTAGADPQVWRKPFGLIGGPETRVIESLAVISPTSEDYLIESVKEPGWSELVRITLEWGRRLNLLRYSMEGRWELDSTIQQLAQDTAG